MNTLKKLTLLAQVLRDVRDSDSKSLEIGTEGTEYACGQAACVMGWACASGVFHELSIEIFGEGEEWTLIRKHSDGKERCTTWDDVGVNYFGLTPVETDMLGSSSRENRNHAFGLWVRWLPVMKRLEMGLACNFEDPFEETTKPRHFISHTPTENDALAVVLLLIENYTVEAP